ncbi:MAG TPA: sigma-70 family RNA polymerase sigma factor [Anaeromyxobacteraceae bacterium]|nr:sigma-70 family RNA polymerase sigma factor [Anaeromyxobacteraceae bacterium]
MVGTIALAAAGFAVPSEVERTVLAEQSDERSLARAAARGDRDAFARLVDSHKRRVHALCFRLLGDAEEARDAAQESFVRAWSAIGSFDTAQPFAPWVLRIARNHCFDLARRRLPAGREVRLDADPADGEAPFELADGDVPAADERLAGAERSAAVATAVAQLPPKYREVIHLFHVEQMAYKDIAAVMDVPMGTVMTWLHRARAKLRETLAGQEERS